MYANGVSIKLSIISNPLPTWARTFRVRLHQCHWTLDRANNSAHANHGENMLKPPWCTPKQAGINLLAQTLNKKTDVLPTWQSRPPTLCTSFCPRYTNSLASSGSFLRDVSVWKLWSRHIQDNVIDLSMSRFFAAKQIHLSSNRLVLCWLGPQPRQYRRRYKYWSSLEHGLSAAVLKNTWKKRVIVVDDGSCL